MLIGSRFQPFTERIYILDTRQSISSLKLLLDDWSTGLSFMAMILNLCPYKHI